MSTNEKCFYDDPPCLIQCFDLWCSRCGWTCPDVRIGTYTRDIVLRGRLYHVVELAQPIVCQECGHSNDTLYRPCNHEALAAEAEKRKETLEAK